MPIVIKLLRRYRPTKLLQGPVRSRYVLCFISTTCILYVLCMISGGPGQNGTPTGPNQLVRAVGQSLQPQLFGQIQFSQSAQNNPLGFPDQNTANHIQLLQQQQHQQQNFQNLNVNFLTEQLAAAGVGQIISQAASVSNQNSQQNMPSISMQSLMTPMALTTLSFPSIQVAQTSSAQQQQQQNNPAIKQRVFTGTVTKTHDNFGFIDDEVFFQTGYKNINCNNITRIDILINLMCGNLKTAIYIL